MTNTKLQTALLRRLGSSKKRAKNGFTLIELMVVVAIVGVLSSVALPQLTKAQDRAKSAAASSTALNAGKTCAIALIGGESTDGDLAASEDDAAVSNGDIACAVDAAFVVTGGGDEWTVTMEDGIPGNPVKSA